MNNRSSDPILWRTADPRKREVSLRARTWDHILDGHPEMLSLDDDVRATVESPDRICEGYREREVFERRVRVPSWARDAFLLVVVAWRQTSTKALVGSVVTAYPDLNRAKGDPTWRRSTNSV